ncbi:MAG: 2-dehydropantoate 2-reductase [Rhodospirillaceae bacterium]|nr:MAG: 2-dehydropantoate 2-reductase [Rhodospirillaceae bacterium]
MKIAVYGSGGVGGYYGSLLAAAGEEVHFIARGSHYEAIRTNGLRVKSQKSGDLHIAPARVTTDPTTIGTVDVVMVAVKLYDTAGAAEGCKALVGPQTSVVSFQNGVTAADTLRAAVGAEAVWGGTAYITSEITEPGLVVHKGGTPRLVFGELDGGETPRVLAFRDVCVKAGIDAVASTKILVDIWSKFSLLAALSGVTALTRKPVGPIRSDPDIRLLFQKAVEEVVAIARAKGIALKENIVAHDMKQLDTLAETAGSSQLHDLIRGRRLELPWLSGAVGRLGRETGLATPIHECIFAALKPYVNGA